MNDSPEFRRLADSITSLAAAIADIIRTEIQAVGCTDGAKQTRVASEAGEVTATATPNSAAKLLLDINEAAELLSISRVSVMKLIRANRLSRIPNFRKILISYDELRKFAANTRK